MTYILRFVPDVEEDVINGHIWYESKSKGLGEEFLRVFYAAASEISHNPLRYPTIYQELRRCLLRRFPYAVYFKVENDQIIVFGLFHCARNPQIIKSELIDRQ